MGDESLVEAYVGGDNEAFNVLAARYQAQIFRLAYRLLGDWEDAQDAVQEVLLRLVKSLPRYKPQAKFSTWLYRLTANTCIDMRRRGTQPQWKSLPDDRPAPESKVDPDVLCEAGFRERVLNLALKELPEPQRYVVVLRDREELSNTEVAEILGIDVGTLKSRLHRARAALRRVLETGVTVPGHEGVGRVSVSPSGELG